MKQYSEKELFRFFSAAQQQEGLLGFTVAENITGCPLGKEDKNRLDWIARKTGLKQVLEKFPKGMKSYCSSEYSEDGINFSGGEKQKIIMARALYKDAPILLLDEPTASLDARAEQKIYEIYEDLTKERLCFFVSHRLGSTSFCDKILFIENSSTIYLDGFDPLYQNNEKFKKMYDEQKKYYVEKSV